MKRTEAHMFEAPFRDRGASFALDPDRMDVPHSVRERIHDQLQAAWGRAVSDEEIMRHATNEKLLEMGLQPEMEFRDIPKDLRNAIRAAHPGVSDERVVDIVLEYALDSAQSDLLGKTKTQAARMRPGATPAEIAMEQDIATEANPYAGEAEHGAVTLGLNDPVPGPVQGPEVAPSALTPEQEARAQRDRLFIPGNFGGTPNTGAQ